MRPLTDKDIESEISYAYLHAVASHVGAGCNIANRASDGNGIDAIVTGWGPFENGGYLQEVDIKVQLKATIGTPVINNRYISYYLKGINRYNDLRTDALATHRILVVMFLPKEVEHWLNITEEELMLKKCAYWVSLRGAPESQNDSGQTIYIPPNQIFNSKSLKEILATRSRNENLIYQLPS